MRGVIVFMLRLIAYLLRIGSERAQRLADRAQTAYARAEESHTSPLPYESGEDTNNPTQPPAHWTQQAQARPSEHWLATVRKHAPYLLAQGFPQYVTGNTASSAAAPPTIAEAKPDTDPPAQYAQQHQSTAPQAVNASSPAVSKSPILRLSPVQQEQRGVIEEFTPTPAAHLAPDVSAASVKQSSAPARAPGPVTANSDPETIPENVNLEAAPGSHEAATTRQASDTGPRSDTVPLRLYPHDETGNSGETMRRNAAATEDTSQIDRGDVGSDVASGYVLAQLQPHSEPQNPIRKPDQSNLLRRPAMQLPSQSKMSGWPQADTVPQAEYRFDTCTTSDQGRWAQLLEEETPSAGFESPEAELDDDLRDRRQRLDREQRGHTWNG